jgi:DNA mismatch repair protein MutS
VYAEFPPAGQLTPLFRQYLEIKAQQPGALLLYRLGDFYEMFGPDAVRASELLGLTLTARPATKDYKVAMCGVPHHSAVRYIKRLVAAGEVVALCEQLTDPAESKGLVERGVTRVITAGTLVEDEYLAADSSNFLCVLAPGARGHYGFAVLESSGGRVELSDWVPPAAGDPRSAPWQTGLAESVLQRYPAEVLLPQELAGDQGFLARMNEAAGFARPTLHSYHTLPNIMEAREHVLHHFNLAALDPIGLQAGSPALLALFALLRYLRETFRADNLPLYPQYVAGGGTLLLDPRTVRHLELLGSSDDGETAGGGLYSALNRCQTSGGRRELKRWLTAPTAVLDELLARQAALDILLSDRTVAAAMGAALAGLADIERIVQRISLRRSNPKELRALVDSLPRLAELAELAGSESASVPAAKSLLLALSTSLHGHGTLYAQLDRELADEPPLQPGDGGVLRSGVDSLLDELRELHSGGSAWFVRYEEALREQTGIRTLKVKQTGPTGWFIEVGKANSVLVPAGWERRGTLVNAERFTTPELREREASSGSAQSRLAARERELLEGLYAQVAVQAEALARGAWAAAQLDVLLSLAAVAREQGWCRVELASSVPGSDGGIRIDLEAARHPLVEASVGSQYYTANDCFLDQARQQVMLITGPNMGGKSSYMRMVATLCVINQLAGYVPARRASLPLLDRIFTRIGAHDALSRGQSTFMVEMLETARILRQCGPASLIVLDEVGRGTSTYDGISIAKAVLEHLHEHPAHPLTLFATHFFELTDLAALLPRLTNFQVEVAQGDGADLLFTYRVIPGAASDSYGIEVARQAGLPDSVVVRAQQILAELEEAKRAALDKARSAVQLGLFGG